MRLQDPTAARAPAAGTNGRQAQQTLHAAAWGSLGQSSSGGGLSSLVQALRGVVSAGLSAGKDVAGKLAQSLDAGLQKAEQSLVSQGMDAKQAAQRVATFRRELARAVHVAAVQAANQSTAAGPSTVAGPSAVATSGAATGGTVTTSPVAASGSVAQSGSTPASVLGVAGAISMRESLQIVTADGARVSIRFSEQDAVAAGSDGSGNSLAALLSRGRIQISVQGTLSAGDLQAVNALVAQVDGLAQQFFSGDVQDAFNSGAALGADPTEIAQFSLHLSYAQIGAVSGPGATGSTVSSTSSGTASGPAATGSAVPTTGSGTAAPASGSAPSGSSADATSAAGSAPVGTSSAAPASSGQSQAASGSAQQTIGSFIQDVLGKLGAVSGTTRLNFSMKWKLELLAAALPAYAPGAQSTAQVTGTQLASGTLRSLAR